MQVKGMWDCGSSYILKKSIKFKDDMTGPCGVLGCIIKHLDLEKESIELNFF